MANLEQRIIVAADLELDRGYVARTIGEFLESWLRRIHLEGKATPVLSIRMEWLASVYPDWIQVVASNNYVRDGLPVAEVKVGPNYFDITTLNDNIRSFGADGTIIPNLAQDLTEFLTQEWRAHRETPAPPTSEAPESMTINQLLEVAEKEENQEKLNAPISQWFANIPEDIRAKLRSESSFFPKKPETLAEYIWLVAKYELKKRESHDQKYTLETGAKDLSSDVSTLQRARRTVRKLRGLT